jgi:hypothetical protein
MPNKEETIARLSGDRDLEEKLVYDLDSYFLSSLETIKDMNQSEKDFFFKTLTVIARDSVRHTGLFAGLLTKVFSDAKDSY